MRTLPCVVQATQLDKTICVVKATKPITWNNHSSPNILDLECAVQSQEKLLFCPSLHQHDHAFD